MKKLLLLIFVGLVIHISGCATNHTISVNSESINQGQIKQTVFGVNNYNKDESNINISHNMMYQNPRWNSSTIPYYSAIEDNDTLQIIRDAVNVWNNHTIIKFIQVDNPKDAYFIIRYGTTKELNSTSESKFILGEANISTTYTGVFNLITSGEVVFVPSSNKCISETTILHELGHILGLDHNEYVDYDVMYPTVDDRTCAIAKITDDINNTISSMYSIEPLPDLAFENAEAKTNSNFLDLNFSIINVGLVESGNISVTVYGNSSDGTSTKISYKNFLPLDSGYGYYDNYYEIPITENFTSISLVMESYKEELNEENNLITLNEGHSSSLVPPTPILLSPADGEEISSIPTLDWSNVVSPNGWYNFYYKENNDTSWTIVYNLTSSEYYANFPVFQGITYDWGVTACNSGFYGVNVKCTNSNVWLFTTPIVTIIISNITPIVH